MIGDWQGCVPCTGSCKKFRAVKCVRPVGHGEQEADVIADGFCEGPKPKESETETCRGTRESGASIVKPEDSRSRKEVEVVAGINAVGSSDSSLRRLSNGAEKRNSEDALSAAGLKSSVGNEKTSSRRGVDETALQKIEYPGMSEKNQERSRKELKRLEVRLALRDTARKRHGRKDEKSGGVLNLKKGFLSVDKEDIKNLTLKIILERDEKNDIMNFPKDFQPQPPENATEFSLMGMDAVKYIQRIQEEGKTISEIPLL